jgi:hypothetical protein
MFSNSSPQIVFYIFKIELFDYFGGLMIFFRWAGFSISFSTAVILLPNMTSGKMRNDFFYVPSSMVDLGELQFYVSPLPWWLIVGKRATFFTHYFMLCS